MTAESQLRHRAALGRRVSFECDFYALPKPAQEALYGIAGELEQAADELQRLWRVEEAAQAHLEHTVRFCVDTEGVCPSHRRLKAALANPAAEER